MVLPPRDPDNTYDLSNIDKSNLFATYLANNFSPHPDINILEHTDHIKQFLVTSFHIAFPTKLTSPSEIIFIINKLPKK